MKFCRIDEFLLCLVVRTGYRIRKKIVKASEIKFLQYVQWFEDKKKVRKRKRIIHKELEMFPPSYKFSEYRNNWLQRTERARDDNGKESWKTAERIA